MTLAIHLEPDPLPQHDYPAALAPPTLEQIDPVLQQRSSFYQARGLREQLVQQLREEHHRQQAPRASLENLERLRDPKTFAVVTGQQPGLLTGPLYTPWKILSTILITERLSRQRAESFIPVFWNAGEDHDTAEMDHFWWLDRQGQPACFRLNLPSEDRPVAFGSRSIATFDTKTLLAFWQEILFETDFSLQIKQIIRESIDFASTLGEFCNQLLWRLFPESGLVIVNSFTRRYPALLRDLLQAEIENPLRAAALVNDAGRQLQAAGFSPQMHKREERCSFFLYEKDARLPVRFSTGRFHCGQSIYGPAQLLRRLEEQPGDFSPAANLRPILQDALLPTALNVLGPGEFAYHLQIKPIYGQLGVPQPPATLRFALTLLPPRVQRGLEKVGLSLAELSQPFGHLAKRLAARQSNLGFEATCAQLKEQIQAAFSRLQEDARTLDKSLEPSIIGNQKQLFALVDKIQDRLATRLSQKSEQLGQQVARLQAVVQPQGQPQERVLNLFYFLNLFGPDLLPGLAGQLQNAQLGSSFIARIENEA